MADTVEGEEEHGTMLVETSEAHNSQVLTEHGEIITVPPSTDVSNGDVAEDILQQALDEASEGYENGDGDYTTEANMAVVADATDHSLAQDSVTDGDNVTYSYVTAIPTAETTQTIPQTIQTAQPGQSLIRLAPTSQVVSAVNQVVTLPSTSTTSIVTSPEQQLAQQVVQVLKPGNVVQRPQVIQTQAPQGPPKTNIIQGLSTIATAAPSVPPVQQTHVQLSQTDSGTPGSITVLTNNGINGEPLGSSSNPIRIIQQGNKYTSVQQLTPEQVAQIMQVVQQQQLAQSTSDGGGSSVLFNPQTQTRIVYRVIYPSELHSKTSTGGAASSESSTPKAAPKTITVPAQMVTLGSTRRPYRKRLKDDDEKVDGPELTKEEKEMKKKHRPRTRSGRVSRPPKHMVQDYKHIHHLDWEEEMDDSDGGYSDYKVTDEEEANEKEVRDSNTLFDGSMAIKPKRFGCEKCDKAYIGAAGLARHFRLYPDHGNAEDVLPQSKTKGTNGVDPPQLHDDSSTQDSISSTASLPTSSSISLSNSVSRIPSSVVATETSPEARSEPLQPAPVSKSANRIPRGVHRARQQYQQENTPTRRKARLKELVRQCTDEELMEMVLPRLSRVITTWEFLLMKVERGRPSRPHIGDMLTEYGTLNKQVEKMCHDYLHPLPESGEGAERHSSVLHLENPVLAQSLGMTTGKYGVRELPKRDDSTFQYKLLTTELGTASGTNNVQVTSSKRTVQLVTPDELIAESPSKKPRLGNSEPYIASVSQQASGVMTVSMANGEGQQLPTIAGINSLSTDSSGTNQGCGENSVVVLSAPKSEHNTEVRTEAAEETQPSNARRVLLQLNQAEITQAANGKNVSEGPAGDAETIISIATGQDTLTIREDTIVTGDSTIIQTDDMEIIENRGSDVHILTPEQSTTPAQIINGNTINHAEETAVTEQALLQEQPPIEVAPDTKAGISIAAFDASAPTETVKTQATTHLNLAHGSKETAMFEHTEGETMLVQSQQAEVAVSMGKPVVVTTGAPAVLSQDGQAVITTQNGQAVLNQDGHVVITPDGQAVLTTQTGTQSGTIINQEGQAVISSETVQTVAIGQDGQPVLSQDGQTVLFTSDGGQTFYTQAADATTVDQSQQHQQQQQLSMEMTPQIVETVNPTIVETTGPQIVSMETPEGLVEGQLVTNEDGTQFLIPHQPEAAGSTDQAVYQTPEGLIVLQNPDGTLRILSNGDSNIPLETVQALLAIDGDSQIQVSESSAT